MGRITSLSMSLLDMMTELSDGNPGALTALAEVATTARETDPDNALGAMGPILFLDTFGIYGSDIWVLFKDICGQSAVRMQAILRAVQMGIVSEREIKNGIALYRLGADRVAGDARVDELLAAVRKQIPRFASVDTLPQGEDVKQASSRSDDSPPGRPNNGSGDQ